MDNFQNEFVMGLFLDDADLTTVNKSVIAMTELLVENEKSLNAFHEAISMVHPSEINDVPTLEPPQVITDYYGQAVVNFSNENYEAIFKAKKTTVKVLIKYVLL